MSAGDPIQNVLDDLLELDDILACMVARYNMISVLPSKDGFQKDVMDIWDIIKRAMDDVFGVVRDYASVGLDVMEFRLGEYSVLFFVLPETENALVAIVPSLSNKGLIEIEMENVRRRIIEILDKEQKMMQH